MTLRSGSDEPGCKSCEGGIAEIGTENAIRVQKLAKWTVVEDVVQDGKDRVNKSTTIEPMALAMETGALAIPDIECKLEIF